jgi:hypothetical protein
VPEVHKVISLESKDDFLMHGVVLQNLVFRPASAMFHVKHLCVRRPRDVSRETIFSSAAHIARAVMFHVKRFCVIPPPEFVSPNSQSYIRAPAPTRKTAP